MGHGASGIDGHRESALEAHTSKNDKRRNERMGITFDRESGDGE